MSPALFMFLALQLIAVGLYPQEMSPGWLRVLPEEPSAIYAVGYSFPYSSSDVTRAKAVENGVIELSRFFFLQIRSETVRWSEEFGAELSNTRSKYLEWLDTSLVNQIKTACTTVGEYREPYTNIFFVLLRLPIVAADSSLSPPFQVQPFKFKDNSVGAPLEPAWVTKTPTSADALFAVGYAERYSDPTVSRTKSIEQARSELAKLVEMRVSNLLDDWAGRNEGIDLAFVRNVSRTVAAATLQGSQIVGFWSNPHTGETYSLGRMYKKAIRVSVRRQASGTFLKTWPVDARKDDIDAAAKKALSDLDRALETLSSDKR